MGKNATTGIRIEDPLGFREQQGQLPNIQLFVRPEAEVIAANSELTQLAGIGPYQGCSVFHDRQINADIVLLQRNAYCRPIHVLPGSSYILKLPVPDHLEPHPRLTCGRSSVKISPESGRRPSYELVQTLKVALPAQVEIQIVLQTVHIHAKHMFLSSVVAARRIERHLIQIACELNCGLVVKEF
jgi:hypothetical protein